jgi:hypothetical protein
MVLKERVLYDQNSCNMQEFLVVILVGVLLRLQEKEPMLELILVGLLRLQEKEPMLE